MTLEPFTRDHASADGLVEGFYLIQRRRARRVDIPVRVWFGPPRDPDDRNAVLDRSPRWQIEIAGILFDGEITAGEFRFAHVTDFWPACQREPIAESEYRFRVERAEWAAEYDPDDAMARPGGRIDPMTATLPGL